MHRQGRRQKQSIVADLDELPSPYLSGVFDLKETVSAEIIVARGCSRTCAYCAICETPLRYFSFDRISRELEHLLAHAPRLEEIFVGAPDIYQNTVLGKRLLQLFRRTAEDRRIRFGFYANIDSLHKAELLRLSNTKWFAIEVGIQTLSKESLRLSNRRSDVGRIKRNVDLFKRCAPRADKVLGFIRGISGDDGSSYIRTLDWGISTGLAFSICHLRVIPNTRLFESHRELGYKVSKRYPYFVLSTDRISEREMRRLSDRTSQVVFPMILLWKEPKLKEAFLRACRMYSAKSRVPYFDAAMDLGRCFAESDRFQTLHRRFMRNSRSEDDFTDLMADQFDFGGIKAGEVLKVLKVFLSRTTRERPGSRGDAPGRLRAV